MPFPFVKSVRWLLMQRPAVRWVFLLSPSPSESLGGVSELAIRTIRRIGQYLGQRLGVSPSISTRQLFQRCSVCLWRGNATLWLHRFPSFSSYVDCTHIIIFCFLFFYFFYSLIYIISLYFLYYSLILFLLMYLFILFILLFIKKKILTG